MEKIRGQTGEKKLIITTFCTTFFYTNLLNFQTISNWISKSHCLHQTPQNFDQSFIFLVRGW